jgi:hypothetical protein
MAFLEQLLLAQLYPVPGALNLKVGLQAGPVCEPVTVDMVKAHLGSTDDADDQNIAIYISACRKIIERAIERTIFTQTWLHVQDYPSRRRATKVYRRPVLRWNSVHYIQDWNTPTPILIDPSFYITSFDQLVPTDFWPIVRSYQSFIINFDSGMVDFGPFNTVGLNSDDLATAIAAAQAQVLLSYPELVLAIMLYVGHFMENREGQGITSRYERSFTLNLPIGDLPKDVKTCIGEYLDWRP